MYHAYSAITFAVVHSLIAVQHVQISYRRVSLIGSLVVAGATVVSYKHLLAGTNPLMASMKAGNCDAQYCNNRGICVLKEKKSGYDWYVNSRFLCGMKHVYSTNKLFPLAFVLLAGMVTDVNLVNQI